MKKDSIKKQNKVVCSMYRIGKLLKNSSIDADTKSLIFSKLDKVNYLDRAIIGASGVNDSSALQMSKFYKRLLKVHRGELLKLLDLHYNFKQ